MNTKIIANFSKLRYSAFVLPLLLLIVIVTILYSQNALSVDHYILLQKDYFYFLNSALLKYSTLLFNFTQLGDALIFLSILSFFLVPAPKMWESLISASLISAIFTVVLKNIFDVPRPAAFFDNDSFFIIGKTLTGHNSLPSGHSITVFTTLTILMYALMPNKLINKIGWILLVFFIGIFLLSTRVGMGAHYPLDVIIGGIIGYISGLLGIFISRKYKIWNWINLKKFYPVFMVLFLACSIIIVIKIIHENLLIFYIAIASLVFSIYKIIQAYVKK